MGYRHDSIPTAVEALVSRPAAYNIVFDHSEDPNWFREGTLEYYDAVIFLSTTGEGTYLKAPLHGKRADSIPNAVLDTDGKTAFQNYLKGGGNFVGIHSAADSLRSTSFYEQEIGP